MNTAVKSARPFSLRNLTWFMIGAFFIIVAARFITDTKLIYLLILVSPLLIYLVIKKTFVFPFGLYLVLVPFDALLSVSSSGTGTTITRLLGILIICALLVKGLTERKIRFKPVNPAAKWMLLFIVYGVLSSLWAIEAAMTFSVLPSLTGLLILYLVATSYKIKENEFGILKVCLLIGGALAGAITSYLFISGQFYFGMGTRATLFLGERGAINPNSLAYDLLFPVAISIEMLVFGKHGKITKGLLLLVFACLLFSIIATGSRKNMLAVGAILLTYAFYSREKRTLLLVCVLIAVVGLYPFISDSFLSRWDTAIESRGSGRLDIWTVGLRSLQKYWLLGVGLANFPNAYTEFADYAPNYVGLYRAAHNLYLEIVVELGLTGLMLMAATFWQHYKAIRPLSGKYNGNQVMLRAVFWAMLISNFFGDFILGKSFWLLWMLIIMYSNISKSGVQGRTRLTAPGFASDYRQ